jgi:VWFA-related protein
MIGTNRPATASLSRGPVQSAANSQSNPFPLELSAAMEQLARATGGVFFHDSDLLKQFRGAIADGREYYVLAYAPKDSARDGRFRSITVETSDKKLSIRAKSGYWAAGAAQ